MFAIRFGDLNLILSNLITPQSRIVYMRNVVQIAQQAAPFLSIDAHPYAAVIGGHVDWILDGYTTTDQYPYSQNAAPSSSRATRACRRRTTTCATR